MTATAENVLFSGSIDGSMAADLRSDWITIPNNCSEVNLFCWWTGDPNGTFKIEESSGGTTVCRTIENTPAGLTSPDGTSYSAPVTTPNAASLGASLIPATTVRGDRIRLFYDRSAGTGTMRAKYTAKLNS